MSREYDQNLSIKKIKHWLKYLTYSALAFGNILVSINIICPVLVFIIQEAGYYVGEDSKKSLKTVGGIGEKESGSIHEANPFRITQS